MSNSMIQMAVSSATKASVLGYLTFTLLASQKGKADGLLVSTEELTYGVQRGVTAATIE
jgi:hypothetical protein